jgi:hypothetical protein
MQRPILSSSSAAMCSGHWILRTVQAFRFGGQGRNPRSHEKYDSVTEKGHSDETRGGGVENIVVMYCINDNSV